MKIGIVGCGLIGARRAQIALESGDQIVAVADTDLSRARQVAEKVGGEPSVDWQSVVRGNVDAVVVATSNNWLAPVTIEALTHRKHVLVEKPMARNAVEAQAVIAAQERNSSLVLKVGFNHRFHPAVFRAHELYEQGAIGDLLFLRGRYGHGGRPGYEKEWRVDVKVSGGGELLDQGIHLIDLFNWFAPDLEQAVGFTETYTWKSASNTAQAEDNAFAIFRSVSGRVASLHVSWTQWKNLFSLEVFGQTGYLLMEGLGGSYGMERLVIGHRRMEGGIPQEETIEYPGKDGSWIAEWQEFKSAIERNSQPVGNGRDGFKALQLIEAVYRSAGSGTVSRLTSR